MIPNLIFCNRTMVSEGDASTGTPATYKNVFSPGRMVAGLLAAGLGIGLSCLPSVKGTGKNKVTTAPAE